MRTKRPMPRQQKSRTIATLLAGRNSSRVQLEEILRGLRVDCTRKDIACLSLEALNQVKHEITLDATTGSQFTWVVIHPGRLLEVAIATSPELAREYANAASRKMPSQASPWSLLVGFDEFAPGAKLRVDNRRKSMVVNLSFLELGHGNLQHDLCWLTCAVVRTTIIKAIVGGWSAMLKQFLLVVLNGREGLSTAGVALTILDRPLALFARLHCLLSDGDGLRQCLDWKGSSGTRPCFRHVNCVSKRCGHEGSSMQESRFAHAFTLPFCRY